MIEFLNLRELIKANLIFKSSQLSIHKYILMLKTLSLQRWVLPGFSLVCQMRFSSDEGNYKAAQAELALERALWASKFITLIRRDDPTQALKGKSLRDLLLEAEIEKVTKLSRSESQKVQTQMKKYFREGIKVGRDRYNQVNLYLIMLKNDIARQSLMTFLPTFTITRRIFQILSRPIENHLLYGNSKVGQSMSLILYKELAGHIWTYKEMYVKDEKQLRYYNELLSKNHIISMPRVIYLSILFEKYQASSKERYQNFQKIILRQVPDLKEELKDKSYSQMLKILKTKNTLFIIDQLDFLSRSYEMWNYSNVSTTQSVRYFSGYFDITQDYLDLMGHITKSVSEITQGGNVLLSASSNIERYLIHKKLSHRSASEKLLGKSINDERKSMKIVDPARYTQEMLPYARSLKTPEGQADFKQFVWNLIEIIIYAAIPRDTPRQFNRYIDDINTFKAYYYEHIKDQSFYMNNSNSFYQLYEGIKQIFYKKYSQNFRQTMFFSDMEANPEQKMPEYYKTIVEYLKLLQDVILQNDQNIFYKNFFQTRKYLYEKKFYLFSILFHIVRDKSLRGQGTGNFQICDKSNNQLQKKAYKLILGLHKIGQLSQNLLKYEIIQENKEEKKSAKIQFIQSPIQFYKKYVKYIEPELQHLKKIEQKMKGSQEYVFAVFPKSLVIILSTVCFIDAVFMEKAQFSQVNFIASEYLKQIILCNKAQKESNNSQDQQLSQQNKQKMEEPIVSNQKKLFKLPEFLVKNSHKSELFNITKKYITPPMQQHYQAMKQVESRSEKSQKKSQFALTYMDLITRLIKQEKAGQDYIIMMMPNYKSSDIQAGAVFTRMTKEERYQMRKGGYLDFIIVNYDKEGDGTLCFNVYGCFENPYQVSISEKLRRAASFLNNYKEAFQNYMKYSIRDGETIFKDGLKIKLVCSIVSFEKDVKEIINTKNLTADLQSAIESLGQNCEIRVIPYEHLHFLRSKSKQTDLFISRLRDVRQKYRLNKGNVSDEIFL